MTFTKQEIKSFYDEATIRKLSGYVYSNRRIEYAWQTLSKIIAYHNTKRVLEIGSGIGDICHRIATEYSNTSVVGFDISDESINISRKLFSEPNLNFIQGDSISEFFNPQIGKFDLIFLMDTYEHIPTEERTPLYDFIKANLSENGFLFLSCPTPQHLDYLKKNKPLEIQPVDQDITHEVLFELSSNTALKLIIYKEVSVWNAGDYFHAVFSNRLKMQPFSDFNENKRSTIGLKNELKKKLKKIIKRNKGIESEQIRNKINKINKRLGEEISKKVLEFR